MSDDARKATVNRANAAALKKSNEREICKSHRHTIINANEKEKINRRDIEMKLKHHRRRQQVTVACDPNTKCRQTRFPVD